MSTVIASPENPAVIAETKGKPARAVKVEVSATPGTVVTVKEKVPVSADVWKVYCRHVAAGTPTKVKGVPILPARLSLLALTDDMREELRASRESYRRACMASKKSILGIIRRKSVHTVAHRTTGRGGNVRYADEKAYKTPTHFQAFLTGKRVADLAPAAK